MSGVHHAARCSQRGYVMSQEQVWYEDLYPPDGMVGTSLPVYSTAVLSPSRCTALPSLFLLTVYSTAVPPPTHRVQHCRPSSPPGIPPGAPLLSPCTALPSLLSPCTALPSLSPAVITREVVPFPAVITREVVPLPAVLPLLRTSFPLFYHC